DLPQFPSPEALRAPLQESVRGVHPKQVRALAASKLEQIDEQMEGAAIRVGKRCATTEDRSPGPPRSASECLGLAGSGNELEVAQVAVVFGVVCNQWRGQNQSGGGDPRIGCAHLAPFPHALVSNLSPGRTQQIVRIQD